MIACGRRIRQLMYCVLMTLAAAGCSGLRSADTVSQVYTLQPRMAEAASNRSSQPAVAALAVVMPVAAPGLNTSSIALLRVDGVLDAYAASRWPEPLPEMLQPLIIDALRAGGAFGSVQSDVGLFNSDYLLRVEVRQFAAVYTGDVHASTPTVQVQLVATLGRRVDRSVLRSFTISESATASANRLSAVVEAFNRAAGAALLKLAAETRIAQ